MNQRVIIEDEQLRINGVAKKEDFSSILAVVNEDVAFVRRYIEPIEPFLALALTEKCPAKIQGLKHKYPLAFTGWDSLPYRNARLFTWGTLEQEQTSRVAYALLHHAKEREELKREFEQLFKREYPKIDEYFKDTEAGHQFNVREMIHLSRLIIKVEECGNVRFLMNTLAVIDYFIEMYDFGYDYETYQEELLDILAVIQRAKQMFLLDYSIKGFNSVMERVDDKFLRRLKNEVRPYLQAYEKRLGTDLVQYCRNLANDYKDSPLLEHHQFWIFRQFGQDIQRLMLNYPITLSDLEQLFYVLLIQSQNQQAPNELKLPEAEVFCDYVDQIFLDALVGYICAKSVTMDRQYFFKNQGFSDAQTMQSMQKEILQMKELLEKQTQRIQGFEDEKNKLKDDHLKKINQQDKLHAEALAEMNKENRRLQKELEDMKEAYEMAKQQAEECEEVSSLMASHDADSWEAKQARWIEQLNRPEILIVGCHPRTIHRLKPMLPNAKYYELDTTVQDYYLRGVEHIFVCLHQVNHPMMFKLERCCPDVPRYPIRKTNAQLIIQELAQALQLD